LRDQKRGEDATECDEYEGVLEEGADSLSGGPLAGGLGVVLLGVSSFRDGAVTAPLLRGPVSAGTGVSSKPEVVSTPTPKG
jgi:hypothetical protein